MSAPEPALGPVGHFNGLLPARPPEAPGHLGATLQKGIELAQQALHGVPFTQLQDAFSEYADHIAGLSRLGSNNLQHRALLAVVLRQTVAEHTETPELPKDLLEKIANNRVTQHEVEQLEGETARTLRGLAGTTYTPEAHTTFGKIITELAPKLSAVEAILKEAAVGALRR